MGILTTVPEPTKLEKAPTEVTPNEVKAPDDASNKLAEMAKREKAIRMQSREMAAIKQEMAKREADFKALQEELERERGFKTKLKTSTWDALLEAGLTPEEATTAFLNQPSEENIELRQLRAELAALKSEQQAFKESSQKAQEQSYSQAKKQIEAEVTNLVKGSESYEFIDKMNAAQQVVDYIESVYQESGQLLDTATAAEHVEEFLMEEALKIAEIKKLKAKLLPQDTPAPTVNAGSQVKTLSNQMNSGSKPLSAKERRERAIAAFKGQLT